MLKKLKNIIFHLILFSTITAIISAAHSQQDTKTGSLAGRISDRESGDPLAHVQVFIASLRAGDVSREDGMYEIKNIRVGTYRVTISLQGYETIQDDVNIQAGKVTRLDAAMPLQPLRVGEILVTASRHATLEQDVPQMVSVLSDIEIREKNVAQTPELLREEVGITVQKTNQGGGSPIIRGLRANKLLIAVDGIRLNNSTYRGGNLQYLNSVDSQSLERIEIVHGPVSALYGSDALGGVINLITKTPPQHDEPVKTVRGFGSARVSSADDTQTGHLGIQAGSHKWGLSLDASYKSYGDVRRGGSGGDRLLERLENDSRADRILTKKQSPNGYDSFDVAAKFNYRANESHEVSFAYQLNRQKEVPRYDAVETQKHALWQYDPQERDLIYVRYENKIPNRIFSTAQVTLSGQRQFERRVRQRTGETVQSRDQFETKTLGVQVQLNKIIAARHFFVYGSEIYFDRVKTESSQLDKADDTVAPLSPLYPDGSTYRNFGLYGQGEFSMANRLRIKVGARYSAFKLKAPFDESGGELANLGTVTMSPTTLTASAGTIYSITETTRLVANIAQGFRAPNLDDVSKFGPGKGGSFFDVPNSNLGPEKVLSFDAGVKVASNDVRLNLIAYYNRITDLLSRRESTFAGLPYVIEGSDTLSVFRVENAGKAYTTGFEFGAEIALSRRLRMIANLSYTYGENRSLNEPLSAIPPTQGLIGLKWDGPRTWLELNARFAAAQDRLSPEDKLDLRVPEGGTLAWYTLSFRYGMQLNDYLTIRFLIANLLDRNYREHMSGMNAPGRNFVLAGEVRL
jgi:TonB-dependent heme/hemoglobin receptor